MAFELTSTAFANGDPIPMKYSCDDQDISPPLQWKDPSRTSVMGGRTSSSLIRRR